MSTDAVEMERWLRTGGPVPAPAPSVDPSDEEIDPTTDELADAWLRSTRHTQNTLREFLGAARRRLRERSHMQRADEFFRNQ